MLPSTSHPVEVMGLVADGHQPARGNPSVIQHLAHAHELAIPFIQADPALGRRLRHQHRLPLTQVEGSITGQPDTRPLGQRVLFYNKNCICIFTHVFDILGWF